MLKNNLYETQWKNYFRYLISRNISKYSSIAFYVYFMWEIIYRYHSLFLVSLVPAFSLLGYFIIVLPEGHLMDKYNRFKLFIIINIFLIITYSVLTINKSLLIIYIVDFFSSLISWVMYDNFHAITKEIVNKNDMNKAVSIDQSVSGISELLGIISGGIFIFVNYSYFVSFLIIISITGLLLSLKYNVKGMYKKNNNASFKHVFIIIKKIYPFLIFSLILNGIFISIDVFSSGLIYIIMKASPIYYTLFIAGFPSGMILGGLLSVNKNIKKINDSMKIIGIYLFLIGILFILIAINRIPIIDFAYSFSMGFIVIFINIKIGSMILNEIPNSITGRFNSVTTLFSAGSSPLMAVVFGFLSEFIYFPYLIAAVGVIAMLLSFMINNIIKGFKNNMEKITDLYPELKDDINN